MIIDGPDSVTPAVLDEIARASNPRQPKSSRSASLNPRARREMA